MSSAAKSPDDERRETQPAAAAVPPLSPEVAKMLDERSAAHEANPEACIPWEVVYAESLKRTQRELSASRGGTGSDFRAGKTASIPR